MPTTARVMPHIRCPAETGQPATGHGGRMTVTVDLQGRTDKQVHRILPGQLAEHPVRTQRTVAPGEEHIRAGGDVVLHPQFGAETMHAFDPATFNGGNQGRGAGLSVQLRQILPFRAEGFTVGRQDQFDGGSVETDPVVEGLHIVFFVDPANRHHRHQHMHGLIWRGSRW